MWPLTNPSLRNWKCLLFCSFLAEREAARVYVHFGDSDEPQWGWEAESRGDRALVRQVRKLVLLLQPVGGVVEHPPMQVTRLLDLQHVYVAPQLHELPRQLLVLPAHVCLQMQARGRKNVQPKKKKQMQEKRSTIMDQWQVLRLVKFHLRALQNCLWPQTVWVHLPSVAFLCTRSKLTTPSWMCGVIEQSKNDYTRRNSVILLWEAQKTHTDWHEQDSSGH